MYNRKICVNAINRDRALRAVAENLIGRFLLSIIYRAYCSTNAKEFVECI
jgi:hypothetical protein